MKNRHILMVEDDPAFMKDMGDILSKSKLASKLTKAETCEEALILIRKTKPDIILQDISFNKSKMDGFTCLENIKHIDASIKVLMFSSTNESILIKKAFALHADGYIIKGASIDEIARAIKTVENGSIYLQGDKEPIFSSLTNN